jgi:SnoaL-like domain
MKFDPAILRDFAVRYTVAWCSQNASSVAEFFSPQAGLSVNGGTPAVGREAITQTVQGFMDAFPDLRVLLDGVVPRGDEVVYSWTLTRTNPTPGGTGQRVHISGFERWTIGEDG